MGREHLLVVDDQPEICEIVAEVAEACGYEALSATDSETFERLYGDEVAVIILDLVMPGTDGIELLRFLADRSCRASIIVMSGFDRRVLKIAQRLGKEHGLKVAGSLAKPFRVAELRRLLDEVDGEPSGEHAAVAPQADLDAAELETAIESHQLVLHFQPQLDIVEGTVYGAEALCRWSHPEHGLVYPDRFIGLAEQNGLIERLTYEVLELAVTACRTWYDQGRELKVSVNVPVSLLSNLELPNRVEELLGRTSLPASALLLEVTETGLIEELRASLDVLSRLRMKGIELAVDDFGTGYATFEQVENVPATELKIDRSFVMNMLTADSARAIVDSVLDIGRRLEMRVLAEGIETEATRAELEAAGCRYGQGYLFSKPLPPPRFVDFLG